jgi:uncharacterized protein involved in response to NO
MADVAVARLRRQAETPAILLYGFRPFFLLGSLYAGLAVLAWVPILHGHFSSSATALTLRDWHAHEMLYGFLPAVITGFLLTAIPNWTGRLPIRGVPLLAMVLVWIAGRVAMNLSGLIGALPAAVIDAVFLPLLAAAAAREIVAGRNIRNLKVLIVILALAAGNIAFHAETIVNGYADYGVRIGLAAVVVLLMLIGGRIVPSFTRNWLARNNPGRLPQPFSRFDGATIGASALALICWIALPQSIVSGVLLIIAGLLQTIRHVRWAGDRTLADRLVLVLHIAYAFVPLGFLLIGAAVIWPAIFPTSAGLHAWTAGAVGLMTLAVMTRASLGHTGQELIASLPTQLIYLCAFVAALARIIAAFEPSRALLHIAAVAWILAFGGFAVVFGRLLIGRPPIWDNRP